MNTQSDIELITFYKNNNNPDTAEILINRHLSLLEKLARNHKAKYPLTQYEDCLQNAKLGMMICLKRFNTQSETKFSTYLYKSVYFYLLSCNDTEALIKCPNYLRGTRNYLTTYDPKQKLEFENKLGLNEFEIQKKFSALNPNFIELIDVEISGENQIVSDLYSKLFIESLPKEDQEILDLLIEGQTVRKVAQIVSKSEKQIRSKLLTLQNVY